MRSTHGVRTVPPMLRAHPDPTQDFAAAVARCTQLQASDGDEVNPACHSWTLTHGLKTERVAVLVHGVTNCPAQYKAFAPLLFEQGYNVLIPRIPWNGFLDRSGKAMRHLTAPELRAFGDSVVDVARGLGERVTVVGLSGGGVVAAWVAQCRSDVERAVVIAPSIGIVPALPLGNEMINRLAMRLMRLLPNMMTQWFRPINVGPPYNYFGFATRGLGAVTQLGFAVMDAARTTAPAAQCMQLILNENDGAVNLPVARDLARCWQATAGNRVDVYIFPRERRLIHDIIDPTQPDQQTDVVYPILLDLITRRSVRPGGNTL